MAFLIGLLNAKGVGFKIAKFSKKAEKSLQYIEVVELTGSVLISKLQLQEIVRQEEASYSTGSTNSINERYHRKNMFSAIHNYLMRIACMQYGDTLSFEKKKTKVSRYTVKMEKFTKVTLNGRIFDMAQILEVGNSIYEFISGEMNDLKCNSVNSFIIVEPYNPCVCRLLRCGDVQLMNRYWCIEEVEEYERQMK